MSNFGRTLAQRSASAEKSPVKRPDWLPEGWTVEVKTRKSGISAGNKDKYYRDPVSGSKFRSKEEVLRYLSGQPNRHSSRKVRRISKDKSTEWLPPGWITEIKTRTHADGSGHICKTYIAPFTGWKFYSKKEVLSYLETGENCRQVAKVKKRIPNTFSSEKPLHAFKRRTLPNLRARRCLFGGQSLKASETTPEMIGAEQMMLNSFSPPKTQVPSKMEGSSVHGELLQGWSLDSGDLKLSEKGTLLDFENNKVSGYGMPLVSDLQNPLEKTVQMKMGGIEEWNVPELEFEGKKELENRMPMDLKGKNTIENEMPQKLKDKTSTEDVLKRINTGVSSLQLSQRRIKKAVNFPCRASKRLAELNSKVASDSACLSYEAYLANPENNRSGKPSLIEEPIKNLEDEKVVGPEISLSMPFSDLFTDPCLEFAFKTLTGAIPGVEYTSDRAY